MIYNTPEDWLNAREKRVLLFGMSGVGKTHAAVKLRKSGDWFHYSVDYRIGTRYMGEEIVDNFRREAMKVPFLASLLKSDSISIVSKITFNNLTPLSTYLGKPGDRERGGIPFEEYRRRQTLHRSAEIASLLDSIHFIRRSTDIYGYSCFVCDSGGSICEVIDLDAPDERVMSRLVEHLLPVWIMGDRDHTERLINRFNQSPKPMYYRPEFLHECWDDYIASGDHAEDDVDPDTFMRWIFAKAIAQRKPRYHAMANRWGVSVASEDLAGIESEQDFIDLIASALEKRNASVSQGSAS